jgi:hypothetical protein
MIHFLIEHEKYNICLYGNTFIHSPRFVVIVVIVDFILIMLVNYPQKTYAH